MRRTAILLAFPLLTAAVCAQETVAPTPDTVGPARGDNVSDYNVVNTFETGVRFFSVGGSLPEYRSNVNYGNGVRLLSSDLTINSKDGHGKYFDEIVLTTQGLGNDPYESATLRIQKNKLYRYDMVWRLNDYVNPGLVTGGADGLHAMDTRYTLQDHDLTLFPQSKIKFFLGYTHSSQGGPAISTVQLFDTNGNPYPVFANVRRSWNGYRVGNEIEFFGIKLNWMRGWEDFKEDTPFASAGTGPVSSFTRQEPYHGTSPYWRVALFADKKLVSFNGRFTYTAGQRGFLLDETALGTSAGTGINRQIVTSGTARRPVATGNATVSFFPTSKLSIVNHTSIYNVRTEGDSTFSQFDNATQSFTYLSFQYLGIRTVANETDVYYQFLPQLGVYAGYDYSSRRIRSIVSADIPFYDQTNKVNSGVLGFRIRPVKPLTIILNGEIGRDSRPFAPKSDGNYHDLGARAEYRHKSLLLSAYAKSDYNTNAVSFSAFASRSRTYSANASWTPREWLSFDVGYTKLHLYTVGGIAYFVDLNLVPGEQSLYFSNLHTGTAGVRFSMGRRADLYVAYSRVQDTGDGRSTPDGSGIGSSLPAFQAAQTFPVLFQSPLARFSFKLSERVRWNVGYQYYGYREDFDRTLGYRANTGYTSILWSF